MISIIPQISTATIMAPSSTTSSLLRSSSPPSRHGSSPFSSSSVNFEDPEAAAASIARLQRALAASREELAEATNTKTKRPATVTTMGRGIRKIVSLYEGLSSIIDEADRRTVNEDGDAIEEHDPRIKRARDRTFTAYNLLLRLVPRLKKAIQDPDMDTFNTFLSDLQDGANAARGDDLKRVKEEVGNWINLDYKPTEVLNSKVRDGRGMQHDVCGALLAPIDFNWDDLEVRANIRACKEGFTITDNYYLNCLYPKDRDTKRIERNFLRSNLLLKVYCCIFTSPSSAEGIEDEAADVPDGPPRKKQKTTGQKKATKANVASLLNMEGKVTGRSIAYAAVLLVFNLTDAVQWVDVYNGINFIAFYNFIVDYFEEFRNDASQQRVQNLLAWWNRYVSDCFSSS
ncbi:hypothetical protein BDZ97DRAFT_1886452 [Flammula alnicola]|nr:hypothetical protein BDZ97DRAFT_1886452 [Flammula alnicola]